jgi:4'-phosphopantetheinyl transferase
MSATPNPAAKPGFLLSVEHGRMTRPKHNSLIMVAQDKCIVCVSEISQLRTELDARVNNLAWLTDAERDRLGQIGSEKRRIQFLLGHYLVRHLASYLHQNEFREWRLQRNFAGQYVLYDDLERHLFGSISHSGRWIAAAVCEAPVGIDIESFESKQRDYLPIASHIFSAPEVTRLSNTPIEQQGHLFYTFWTLKEAAAKRDGQGLRSHITRASAAAETSQTNEASFMVWANTDFVTSVTYQQHTEYEQHGLLAELGKPQLWEQKAISYITAEQYAVQG